jgi:hypothetical protein
MAIVEAYKTNRPMREQYFRMNGITHVEVWDTDDGYMPALCGGEGEGWPEREREFATVGQVMQWAATYCPELPFTS